jgi:hypothetical protein
MVCLAGCCPFVVTTAVTTKSTTPPGYYQSMSGDQPAPPPRSKCQVLTGFRLSQMLVFVSLLALIKPPGIHSGIHGLRSLMTGYRVGDQAR